MKSRIKQLVDDSKDQTRHNISKHDKAIDKDHHLGEKKAHKPSLKIEIDKTSFAHNSRPQLLN